MKQIDVAWLIEHSVRELDVACAVKMLAERDYGLHVELIPIGSEVRAITSRFKPRLVATPYFYTVTKHAPKDYLAFWQNAIYFNLTWEQLLYKANQKYKVLKDSYVKQHILHHAWGDFFKEYLMGQGVPAEHITVNGHPAYKLYDRPYRDYFPTRAELANRIGIDPNRRWVFFPENYNWAFYPDWALEENIKNGGDRETLYALREFCQQSLKEVVCWCDRIARQRNVEIVLRPRPTTSVKVMKARVGQILGEIPEHLRIVKDLTIREWILASDIVVSSYSTSLVEAAVACKPVYMLEPYPIPDSLQVDWQKYPRHLTTYEEFDATCSGIPDWAETQSLHDWARENMLSHGDPICGLTQLLWEFTRPDFERPLMPPAELCPSQDTVPKPGPVLAARRMKGKLEVQLRRLLQPSVPYAFYDTEGFTSKDIDRRVGLWAQVLNHQ